MTLVIKDREGVRPAEEMRAHFERAIKETPAFASNTPLGPVTINGNFSHYFDEDTDTMWLGFALGMRCADRLAKATTSQGGAS